MESAEQRTARIQELELARAERRGGSVDLEPYRAPVSSEAPEQRSLANPPGWLSEALGVRSTPAGRPVSARKALGLGPVWSAVSIIAEQVGQLPLKVYRKVEEGDRIEARSHRAWRMLHDKPNEHTPADRFWSTVTVHLLLYGNAFIEKRRDEFGIVDQLFLLDPARVTVSWDQRRSLKGYLVAPEHLGETPLVFDDNDVVHIFGLSLDGVVGLSVIQHCASPFSTALARDEYEGGFYRRGGTLSGVVQHPDRLSNDAIAHLKQSVNAIYGGVDKAHQIGVLEEGAEFKIMGSPMRDLEFVASQNMSRTDIAVMFKLPPNYLGGSSGDALTYSTVESNSIHFALHAIAPWTNTIAKALSHDPGILPQGVHEAEFVLEAMLRGAAMDRAQFYEKMVAVGAITADEIRKRENMPALTAAQKAELKPPPPPPASPAGPAADAAEGNGAASLPPAPVPPRNQ